MSATTDDERAFVEFRQRLAVALDLPPSLVEPDAHLVEDLNVDSIGQFALLLFLEETHGGEVPEDLLVGLSTVGDVFGWYLTYRERDMR